MILYQLVCDHDHTFEAWFRDSASYDEQVAMGEVTCPHCGTPDVRKALMAPRLGRRKGQGAPAAPPAQETAAPAPAKATAPPTGGDDTVKTVAGRNLDFAANIREALHDLRRQVESHCDYVGDRFAEEARKIHYGESESRPIYGETTKEEAQDLKDEGVDVVSVPWLKSDG